MGEDGCVIIYTDLNNPIYAGYRALLGENLDIDRIIEGSFECPT